MLKLVQNSLSRGLTPAHEFTVWCLSAWAWFFLVGMCLAPAWGADGGVVLEVLHPFTGAADGGAPRAALVEGGGGDFYGTSYAGGTNGGWGTAFKVSKDGALTSIHSFSGGSDGAGPYAPLVAGSDGNLCGTTSEGGAASAGTVFEISPGGMLTNLCPSIGSNGPVEPGAWLAAGVDGYFYGTTTEGGSRYRGSVCKIAANGAQTTLYSFDGYDGEFPEGALILARDGYLYGATSSGGTNSGYGTIFRISTNGDFTSLYSARTNDGSGFNAPLVQASDGYLYGTAARGGNGGFGTVFRASTNGPLTNLWSFSGAGDGGTPNGGLIQATDGNLYGTAYYGGLASSNISGYGTVFRITTNGALNTLYTFTGGNDGANPYAGLVQGSDGNFYGTTYLGGLGGAGTVFRLTILPEFLSETSTNGALTFTWSTETGGTYQLQYTSEVTSSNWTNLGGAMVATGSSLSGTDSVTNNAQRFYRVVLAP